MIHFARHFLTKDERMKNTCIHYNGQMEEDRYRILDALYY